MNRRLEVTLAIAAAALLLLAASPVMALDAEYGVDKAKPPAAKGGTGWEGSVAAGGNLSIGSSHNVVGQAEGTAWTIGVNLAGTADYIKGVHDWRNTLTLNESFTYGPPLDAFVKSADRLFFESIYYYHIPGAKWVGPFARFSLDAPIFENADHRPAPVTYAISDLDGNVRNVTDSRLHLTNEFKPLVLQEAVGVFLRPLDLEVCAIEIRAGFGANETFASGQLAVADDASTPAVDIKTLASFVEAGAEAGITVTGTAYQGRIAYKAYAQTLVPSIRHRDGPADPRSTGALTEVEIGAKLAFKLVDWASVVYELRVLRQPLLADGFQITNSLLLSLGYARQWKEAPDAAPAATPPAATPAK